MPHVEGAGDIWGRDVDAKGFTGSLYVGMEISPLNPDLIPAGIDFFGL
jgi:hypothetical protein